jgi:hypothetical protein
MSMTQRRFSWRRLEPRIRDLLNRRWFSGSLEIFRTLALISTRYKERYSTRSSMAEVLGIWAALSATPLAIVSVLNIAAEVKVVWVVTLVIVAALLTIAIEQRSRAGRLFLLAVMLISILIGGLAGNRWEHELRRATAPACVPPGSGNREYEPAFSRAYERRGGAEVLGCPLGPVQALEGAYHQNLDGPNGPSVIMATNPEEAYVIAGPAYAAFLAIGGGNGVQSSVQAGFPYSDEVRGRKGSEIELGAGGRWERSGLVGRTGGRWYWIHPQLWKRYKGELGGPDGRLQYPKGSSRPWENGIRQDFEGGWLWYRIDRGTLTRDEYIAGKSKPDPRETGLGTHKVIYQVDSDNGIPHEIGAGGSVRQAFRPSTPFIDEIGVIVGIDPRHDREALHPLFIQLLDSREKVLASERVDDFRNNQLTTVTFRPVVVDVGASYFLSVINDSHDTIGVYLNSPGTHGSPADPGARAYLIGEIPRPSPHFDSVGALSGRVVGGTG